MLAKRNLFLRFYERRNKFRYQLKQKLNTKNEMKRELPSCAIQKFNRYKLLRHKLKNTETIDFTPIDIVYEPTLKENEPILCFFSPDIFLAFNTAVGKTKNGK